jgi:hypothetical protein
VKADMNEPERRRIRESRQRWVPRCLAVAAMLACTGSALQSGVGPTDVSPGGTDVCFYLHFYDPAEPFHTPYGDVALPPVTALPPRLRHLHYEYVD